MLLLTLMALELAAWGPISRDRRSGELSLRAKSSVAPIMGAVAVCFSIDDGLQRYKAGRRNVLAGRRLEPLSLLVKKSRRPIVGPR